MRPELAEREAPSRRRRWRVAERQLRRAGERKARARVEDRKWERRQRRRRSGTPGGRPGCIHAAACSPRGGRALPACHGGTARAGWAGFGQRARSEAAAC